MKVLIFIFSLLAPALFACGPFFPNTWFFNNFENLDGGYLYANFAKELELMRLEAKAEWDKPESRLHSLSRLAPPRPKRSMRDAEKMDFLRLVPDGNAEAYLKLAFDEAREGKAPNWSAVPDLPEQLRLFLRGWEIVRSSDPEKTVAAPEEWLKLANDPQNAPDRTVWACYMLGNLAASQGDEAGRRKWHELCRKRVREGYSDSAGLGFATLKQELRGRKKDGRVLAALYRYYLEPDIRNLEELYYVVKQEIAAYEAWVEIPELRELYAAFWMTSAGYYVKPEFLDRVEKKNIKLTNSARMACLAWQAGKPELCERWLKQIKKEDVLSDWLYANLARARGDRDAELRYLRSWMKRIDESGVRFVSTNPAEEGAMLGFESHFEQPPQETGRAFSAERKSVMLRIGGIQVEKGDLEQALFCFLKANSTLDAAQIAEHMMTTEDLLRYVSAFSATRFRTLKPEQFKVLEDIVSRRLIREGRFEDALAILRPTSLRASLLRLYMSELGESLNPSLSSDLRSLHLYNAARVMYWKGMELQGAVTSPDFAFFGGNYMTDPNHRFLYRDQALEMIWQASRLAQDKGLKALILYSGGVYSVRAYPHGDQKTADLFYKRLVRECRFLPLAVYCDKKRWFDPGHVELPAIYTIAPVESLSEVHKMLRSSVSHDQVPTMPRALMDPR